MDDKTTEEQAETQDPLDDDQQPDEPVHDDEADQQSDTPVRPVVPEVLSPGGVADYSPMLATVTTQSDANSAVTSVTLALTYPDFPWCTTIVARASVDIFESSTIKMALKTDANDNRVGKATFVLKAGQPTQDVSVSFSLTDAGNHHVDLPQSTLIRKRAAS